MAVFYRQYRPQKFSDLVGQEVIAKILVSQLESARFGHGYLFFGPKGTGKTSAARIFAKSVNCLKYGKRDEKKRKIKMGEPCDKCISCLAVLDGSNLDLIEIDAASNRGIDEIRDLREKIKLSPVSSRFKVYIIDEAHMLTTEAFNALLKTLEEPPAHAIFILCTTEINKLPATIVSRLQKFNFSRARGEDLEKVVSKIAKAEAINIEKDAIGEIAHVADGSYRDAVSIFDQLASKGKSIKTSDVAEIAKVGGWDQLYKFGQLIAAKKLKSAVLLIENLADKGADISFFAKQAVLFFEKLLFIKIGIEGGTISDLSSDQVEKMKTLASEFESSELQTAMKQFLVAESEIKIYPLPQIPLVLTVCKIIGDGENEQDALTVQEVREKKIEKPSIESDKSTQKSKINNNGSASVKQIEKNWDQFIKKVKPLNAHVVALLRSAKPVDFDGTRLTLEVFYRFHKEKLEEPRIIRMLDGVMGDILNKSVRFKFVLASRETKPPRVVSKSNVVEISSDDLEQITQEIFSK
ncbi:DNA polymerase III, subunit gamma and tau [Candidatus Curtissbacteria bacterium RIFCSPLOWO2_01_FULL_39_62]|uniref:DNA polymerase III subunit gamma/tau n=2 Tax=Candidatus Curtissiibacteriota TaxID=1752717 RepID=A0A1F5GBD3_9BACT|nr:MAG: DNA polymerase III, subunit gamma and tau [Candidatus Curtissbacteria bacterium RIFCSPHIGHO2_02_FULL_40_16b]OGD90619.1 MAG: DNA polymerase III, subunit gamma and tau [Candidatus Curtissbacteria bacterium RIFCSPHIGHO2_12_FULL_38_37]OGE00326.1 MAG: DNA polymerase III, subunit gamma and tau [Candidatus Curtissbacteria bacterium RIFCSPLOWO2_02_FULL_40_11]OGE00458.1 MAG: DNA polymerase III, subunit gamma and tau [Candidatus Curtissbacteria bacterium RIFCSPLOWO2_01_FULL_39_62]OGE14307.1 MAG: 